MRHPLIAALLAVMLAAAVLASSLFVVGQSDSALCARFGRLQPQTYGPGLHWKSPVDHVLRFDQRLVTHVYPGESFLTADQRSLNIDFLLRLRVSDAMAFYQSAGGDEDAAAQRLADATRDRLKATVAGESLLSVSTMERGGLSAQGFQALQATARGMGLALVDLQLQRIDLSDQAADAVYQRMEQDFNTRAQALDAGGALQADQIRAEAARRRSRTVRAMHSASAPMPMPGPRFFMPTPMAAIPSLPRSCRVLPPTKAPSARRAICWSSRLRVTSSNICTVRAAIRLRPVPRSISVSAAALATVPEPLRVIEQVRSDSPCV